MEEKMRSHRNRLSSDHHYMTKVAIGALSQKEKRFLEPERELLFTLYCEFPDMNWLVYGECGGWSGFPNEPRLPDYRREWNISYYCGWDPAANRERKRLMHAPPDAYKACRVYTKKVWTSFENGRFADGVRFLGILSHYIEDCATFAHMQALHRGEKFDYKIINIDGYKPELLGRTKKEVEEGIIRRLKNVVRYVEERAILLREVIRDNNQKRFKLIHLECLNEGARAVADTFHTIISLFDKKPKIEKNPYGNNLIKNPSFETDDGSGYPNGWVIVYRNLYDKIGRAEYEGLLNRNAGLTHSGKHSVKLMWIPKEGMEWIQRWPSALPVNKGEIYRCTGWIRTRDATGETCICVYLYRRNNEKIGKFKSKSFRGSGDWGRVSFEFRIPEGAEKLRVACHSKGNNGAAWFDDIELIRVRKREKVKENGNKDMLLLKLDFNEEKIRDFYAASTAVMGANIQDTSSFYELNAPIISCSGSRISDLHLTNIDNVLKFDGKDDFVEVPCSFVQDVLNPEQEITITLWVFVEDKRDAYIICKEAKDKLNYYGYRIDIIKEGFIRFIVSNNGIDHSFCLTKYKKNKWMHIAGILRRDGLQRIYLNGKVVDERKKEGGITGCGRSLYIGSNYGVDSFFKGMIGKVRIYGRALGLKEAKNISKDKEI